MPTPRPPPRTLSAVRSIPAAERANNRPANSSRARVMFTPILRSERSLVTSRSRRASMTADSHRASIITSTAVNPPSSRARRDTWLAPIFQRMLSISSRISGSRPVIQSTDAPQAIQDTLRSTTLTQLASGRAARSTRAVRRMTSRDISTGKASLNRAGVSSSQGSRRLAPRASSRASPGNRAPSTTCWPKSTECLSCCEARRGWIRRTTSQARPTQATSRPSSVRTAGLKKLRPRASNSLIVITG